MKSDKVTPMTPRLARWLSGFRIVLPAETTIHDANGILCALLVAGEKVRKLRVHNPRQQAILSESLAAMQMDDRMEAFLSTYGASYSIIKEGYTDFDLDEPVRLHIVKVNAKAGIHNLNRFGDELLVESMREFGFDPSPSAALSIRANRIRQLQDLIDDIEKVENSGRCDRFSALET